MPARDTKGNTPGSRSGRSDRGRLNLTGQSLSIAWLAFGGNLQSAFDSTQGWIT